jgi:hypothetical protein
MGRWYLSRQNGAVGNEHGCGVLNTKFAKERKDPNGCFALYACEFFQANFALKRVRVGQLRFWGLFGLQFFGGDLEFWPDRIEFDR